MNHRQIFLELIKTISFVFHTDIVHFYVVERGKSTCLSIVFETQKKPEADSKGVVRHRTHLPRLSIFFVLTAYERYVHVFNCSELD